ncbi:hypothetical protein J3L18_05280 [Mucilaginibacter gossypii]|uniref:hypothetical protein n=1 Tax=Mucilaginibacter gossypii TaxID=551996 RepID=UPI000DCE8592|nr:MULTISPECIES: hypothetical protein [Mucilaginibacter]QTE38490.1 hypothetical protein J3L18_05280 [Mucilaginibacter gossypii]RAV55773.1 hypothetical protein DIU36_16915 [Mucilaginibacter rubeus]
MPGITIPTSLPAIAFSRNYLPFAPLSDNYQAAAPAKSVNRLSFTGAIVADAVVNLVWTAAAAEMTAKAEPDDSGLQFPAGDGGNDYVTSLVDWFAGNYFIQEYYAVTVDLAAAHPALIFTALDAGPDGDMNPFAVGNIQLTIDTEGVTELPLEGFAHYVSLWIANDAGTGFNLAYEANVPLDENPVTGFSTIDISNALDAFLTTDKPVFANNFFNCPGTLRQYYAKYAQVYGADPSIKRVYKTAPAFINFGGLDIMTENGKTMTGYLRPGGNNANTLCLKQGSKAVLVQKEQPEWLYWINLTGADIDIRVRIELFFTDNTGVPFLLGAKTALAYNKYAVCVGYNFLNLDASVPSGKTPAYYTARIVSSTGSYLSAIYTYTLDVYREWPRYFVYLNSLGGYQTLYCWGKGQDTTSRTADTGERNANNIQAANSGRLLEANIKLSNGTKVNTGYTSKRAIQLLKDFLASEDKYVYQDGRLIPIGIKADSLDQPADGANLNAGTFEYYPLFDEVTYTDNADQPDDTHNSGGLIPTSNTYDAIWDDDNNDDDLAYDDDDL